MKTIKNLVKLLLPQENFDALAVGIIDFKTNSYEAFETTQFEGELKLKSEPTIYFDLASLTKPLTNSLSYFLKPDAFDKDTHLCLSHCGGLPAWGLLPTKGWREQIKAYGVKESETLYSDFSALRVLVNLEDKGVDVKKLCQTVWDKELMSWLDLPPWYPTVQFGYKNGRPNFGQVHDPNAYAIGAFTSHAGLFATVDGLCRTLLNYQNKTDFLKKVALESETNKNRFLFGWDRVENPESTLAGVGCGPHTFGHLGFTGTSIWIDPDKQRGHVILSNATKYYWYQKAGLNDLRRAIGECVWK